MVKDIGLTDGKYESEIDEDRVSVVCGVDCEMRDRIERLHG